MSSSEASFWKEFIDSEIKFILGNNNWQLVDLPPRTKLIGYKWIFKKKLNTIVQLKNTRLDLLSMDFIKKTVLSILTLIHRQ